VTATGECSRIARELTAANVATPTNQNLQNGPLTFCQTERLYRGRGMSGNTVMRSVRLAQRKGAESSGEDSSVEAKGPGTEADLTNI
jgi:hypothetical protein